MIIASFSGKAANQLDVKIPVAVYLEEKEDSFAVQYLDKLMEQDGIMKFYQTDSIEKVKDDVAGRRAECGFILKKGFQEGLAKQELKDRITLIRSEGTTVDGLAKELAIAVLMEEYNPYLLKQFVDTAPIFQKEKREQVTKELEKQLEQVKGEGGVFQFQYETVEGKPVSEKVLSETSSSIMPIRGILAVYLFVISLLVTAEFCEEQKKGKFARISGYNRKKADFLYLAAPITMMFPVLLAAIYLARVWENLGMEVFALVGYSILLICLSFLLKTVIQKPSMIMGVIPFLTIAALLFCPIFFRASTWFSTAKILEKCMPPYWYLSWFL